MRTLQQAAEAYLVGLVSEGFAHVIGGERSTLDPRDIQAARQCRRTCIWVPPSVGGAQQMVALNTPLTPTAVEMKLNSRLVETLQLKKMAATQAVEKAKATLIECSSQGKLFDCHMDANAIQATSEREAHVSELKALEARIKAAGSA